MSEYDFFIAGRWRNKDEILPVVQALRSYGKKVYCFIENDYHGEQVEFDFDSDPDVFMKQMEALPQSHPLIQKIFQTDMEAQKASQAFVLVLPAGIAGHIEAGAAYGLGKPCYSIGKTEKTETLYGVFDQMFPDLESFMAWVSTTRPA